jgi:predicted transcriptional regulator
LQDLQAVFADVGKLDVQGVEEESQRLEKHSKNFSKDYIAHFVIKGHSPRLMVSIELNPFPRASIMNIISVKVVTVSMLSLEGRRSTIQIVAEILRLLRLGEASRTEVMYTVNMSHHQARKYVSWLLELGLVEEIDKEHRFACYRATSKGLQLLSQIEHMQEMLQGEEGLKNLTVLEPARTPREQPHRRILKRLGKFIRQR